MKRTTYLFSSLLSISALMVFSACNKDDDPVVVQDDIYTISATMSAANEVPVNTSTATGTTTGNYNATKNLLTYNVTWTGLTGTATVGHFHSPALPGTNASPLVF